MSGKNNNSGGENAEHRILVLDYDADFFENYKGLLESEGYRLKFVENEESAIELIKSFSPVVILVDIRIWYISGVELFRNLRRGRENIFCIVISHFAEIDVALDAILEGAYDYLRKPIIKMDLLNTLHECFHHTIPGEAGAAENGFWVVADK